MEMLKSMNWPARIYTTAENWGASYFGLNCNNDHFLIILFGCLIAKWNKYLLWNAKKLKSLLH